MYFIRICALLCLLCLAPLGGAEAEQVPDFSWTDMQGAAHTIGELAGRPVVIHFWASWCQPCRSEFSALLSAAQGLDSQITFLAISSDEDKTNALRFIRQAQARSGRMPSNVLYALDADKAITVDLFQTLQYPETILIDRSHVMRRKFAGPVDWNSSAVREELLGLRYH